MDLPTVAELCAALPRDLLVADGFDAPDAPVTAVHVSELSDPTSYLSGGELLLTTGLSLPDSAMGCDRYVSRLLGVGVSALGLGLGPTVTEIPSNLAASCRKHGLCLLVVPPESAFLTVTKTYWTSRSRSTQQQLSDAITAHRSLVNAVVSSNPVAETLKSLSGAIGAWVATLDPSGQVEHVYPSGRVADAIAVADQIKDLRVAGIHSTATFPSGDEVVAVFPLPLEERVVGYIAVGSPASLTSTDRRLVLTASALLSLNAVQRQRADAGAQSQLQAVATLLDMGFTDAAHRLSSRLRLADIGDSARVLAVRSSRPVDVVTAVLQWNRGAIPAPADADQCWFVLPAAQTDIAALVPLLKDVDPRAAAALSDVVPVATLHEVRVGLLATVATAPDGSVAGPRQAALAPDVVREGIGRVLDYTRADLVPALVAYLRHRGQWDPAARDLGVHRNTLRHRITRCRGCWAPTLTIPMWPPSCGCTCEATVWPDGVDQGS
ncbi:PucR family transcriptional regulator ligand-binding domain-containing protein [Aeromicrobium sp. UC242_57]|uniref:PucR family transcriptional regulator n=1 Tax=Aeromicrobium sp. UC242_57 TaxID=3374624 RepID=UPI0037B83CF6